MSSKFEERIQPIKMKLKAYLDEYEKLRRAAIHTTNFIECIDLNGGYEDGRIKIKRNNANVLDAEIEGVLVYHGDLIYNFKKLIQHQEELERICHVLEKINRQINEVDNILSWADQLYKAGMIREYNEIVDEVLKLFEEPEYLE